MRSCLMLSLFSLASAISDFPALDHIRPSSSLFDQQQAATDLIVRRLGADRAKQFTVKVVPNADPQHRDTFTLISDGNLVSITGTSGVAASMGFYFYLKTYCGCQFTWAGEQLDLPHPLPVIVKPGVSITTNDRFRYYQNVCTVSYSSVWWTWERWERHIDWMAMNGINLPLAFTGQEAMFQKMQEEFGTDHVYNADSFNEMSPRSRLMQGWLFQSGFWQQEQIQAYLTAVPQGPFLGRHFEGSSMIGTGLTPEGIFQNEVVYEFMNENAYAPAPRNLTQWFSEFARNRYGQYNSDADQTWQLLRSSVYKGSAHMSVGLSGGLLFSGHGAVPTLEPRIPGAFPHQSVLNNTDKLRDHSKFVVPTSRPNIKEHLPDVWYDPKKLYMAWKHLVAASESLRNNTLFRYDLVDVGRNSLQMISVKFYIEMVAAYKAKSVDRLKSAGEAMLKILNDLDQLLGTDHHFLLGPWIEDARAWGTNEAEKNLMEFNARNQVTLWGPTGQGTKYNQTAFQEIVLETVEQPFSYDRTPVPVQPRGDAVVLSRTLYQQYQPVMQSSFYDSLEGWAGKGSEGFTMAINWLQERWGDTEVRVSLFN
ncbi:ANAG-like protein [Mya arenaria]|uniref:ANAG-like protein n=1 Tax=Mya arenaria TaxID=6604 RepID=A0ABY7FPS5_MYAAR|nr:ANAG-like protein [Mya arenaria]